MAKGKTVKIEDLGAAISEELTIYRKDVVEAIDAAGDKAVKELVKKTKATAPKDRGEFRKAISGKRLEKTDRGSKHVWYVKAPHHRLTHLLVHGHAKRDGGRTKADPFLRKALDQVLPEYEKDVKEALQNGK
jgi:hypothetical protein